MGNRSTMMWNKKTEIDIQSNSAAIRWNYIVFIAGNFSLFLDFFFMYVPVPGSPNSLCSDWQLGACIALLRSIADIIIFCGLISLRSHTVKMIPSKPIALERQVTKMPKYTLSLFIDLIALLPLPQIVVGLKLLELDGLFWCVILQLPFRALALSPYSERTVNIWGILPKNAWSGALQNLFFFIMISHAVGGFYYDAYISKLLHCRIITARHEPDFATLNWDELLTRCTQKYEVEFGILSDAFSTKIGTRSFTQKYTYCLAWGLKSLSSFGQIFSISPYPVDTVFSFFVVTFGLILFGDLLARMQTGLQCTEQKEDRQRTRHRMVEEWMKYHQLPQPLKKQVKQTIQSEWRTTRGIKDETILDSLPWDTRSDVRHHLYMETIRTMPLFERMDEDLVKAICGHLRTFSSSEGTYVTFEGEPVHQMLFIFSGQLEVLNANEGRQHMILGPGDLCGKELLEWCSHPTTSTEHPKPATQTIKCITNVDAFALRVDELKLLAIQFHHDGQFRYAFQRYAA